MVEDRHAGPAETARVRLDFSDWLASLKRRTAAPPSSLPAAKRRSTAASSVSAKAACLSCAASLPPTGVALSATTLVLPRRPSCFPYILSGRPVRKGRAARLSWSFL